MKKNSYSKVLILILIALFTLSFLGCGKEKSKQSGKAQITVSFWGSPKEIDIIEDVVGEWDKNHPEVDVLLDHTPYSGYISKILTRIAGGTAPDIIACEVNLFPNFWGTDVFLNLNPYIKNDPSFSKDAFFKDVLKRFTVNGKIYGIPRDTAPFACVYYNKHLFDKAGLEYPTNDWNWNDLLRKAKKLTVKDKNGEIKQYGFYTWAWQNFVYSNGGSIVNDVENPTEFTLDNPKAIEGLEFYVDLIKKYEVSPSPMNLVNMGMGVEMMFKTERLAMLGSGIWESPALRDIKDFKWDVVMFPKGPSGIRAFGTGGTGYCILKDTEYPDLAWEIVKTLTSKETQRRLSEVGLIQPSRIKVAKGPAFAKSPKPPKNKGMLNEAVKHVVYQPFHYRWREIKSLHITQKLDLVYMGKLSVAEAMKQLDPKVNKILESEK